MLLLSSRHSCHIPKCFYLCCLRMEILMLMPFNGKNTCYQSTLWILTSLLIFCPIRGNDWLLYPVHQNVFFLLVFFFLSLSHPDDCHWINGQMHALKCMHTWKVHLVFCSFCHCLCTSKKPQNISTHKEKCLQSCLVKANWLKLLRKENIIFQ